VRSRASVVFVLLQAALFILLQKFLPFFGLDEIPFCVVGASFQGLDLGISVDEAVPILEAFSYVLFAYFAMSLVALTEWNSELWLLPAATLAWAVFGVRARLDLPSCIALARLPPNTEVTVYADDDGTLTNPVNSISSTIYVFYNLLLIILTGIVAADLTRLSIPVVRTLFTSERSTLLWGSVDDQQPAGDRCVHHRCHGGSAPPSVALSPLQSIRNRVVSLYREHLACVPLRHAIACLLSTIALVYFALYFTAFFVMLANFVSQVRDLYNIFDPDSPLPSDPTDVVIWGLCQVLHTLGESTVSQIFGTVR